MQELNGFVTMSNDHIYEFYNGQIKELNNGYGCGLFAAKSKDLNCGCCCEYGGLFPFKNLLDDKWFIVELRFVF